MSSAEPLVSDSLRTVQDMPKVMGDDEQFHVTDEAVDLSHTTIEGWVALAIFWLLGLTVFYQFFTRYVLNNSASWTEEIARYLLIGTVFVGAAIGVAKNNHIQVDLLYRYLPDSAARVLATAVDVLRIAFFAAMVVLTAQIKKREAELVEEFKKKGLGVHQVDRQSFVDAVLKSSTPESMGFSRADYDKIVAIK